MKFTFACKKISLNDSIKEYAEKKISKLDKYFPPHYSAKQREDVIIQLLEQWSKEQAE